MVCEGGEVVSKLVSRLALLREQTLTTNCSCKQATNPEISSGGIQSQLTLFSSSDCSTTVLVSVSVEVGTNVGANVCSFVCLELLEKPETVV